MVSEAVMNPRIRILLLAVLLGGGALTVAAQQQHSVPAPASAQAAQTVAIAPTAPTPDTAAKHEHATEAKEAEGEEEENAQFKMSPSVRWMSKLIGISPERGYWVFVIINFAIIAGFIYWAASKGLGSAFRARTASIQKGLEDARKASADSDARLKDIEGRLARLDAEVAGIRTAAEADLAAEEQRIRQATEDDARRVVESAESEIAAAAKSARRELKGYAAELAVDLARKQIKVDPRTDAELLRSFVGQLGKDGQ